MKLTKRKFSFEQIQSAFDGGFSAAKDQDLQIIGEQFKEIKTPIKIKFLYFQEWLKENIK